MKTKDVIPAPSYSEELRNVAIVAARWHEEVVGRLTEGAHTALLKAGVPAEKIALFHVSGSFEIPQAVQALAESQHYSAIVPVGCIVRGETPHFELIARTVFQSLDEIGRRFHVAVSTGVLTVDTIEQAAARAGGKLGNKGEEAALAAIDLAALLFKVKHGK